MDVTIRYWRDLLGLRILAGSEPDAACRLNVKSYVKHFLEHIPGDKGHPDECLFARAFSRQAGLNIPK